MGVLLERNSFLPAAMCGLMLSWEIFSRVLSKSKSHADKQILDSKKAQFTCIGGTSEHRPKDSAHARKHALEAIPK